MFLEGCQEASNFHNEMSHQYQLISITKPSLRQAVKTGLSEKTRSQETVKQKPNPLMRLQTKEKTSQVLTPRLTHKTYIEEVPPLTISSCFFPNN